MNERLQLLGKLISIIDSTYKDDDCVIEILEMTHVKTQ